MGYTSMSESGSKKQQTTARPAGRQDLQKLLELRSQIKARTPYFRRFESWRYVRIHPEWRKPKGIDNHLRKSYKGWPHLVKIGYRVPKEVRHLHPSGYRDILVHNLVELEALSPETDAARLAAGVGRRKKIDLAIRAKELGIRVLNGRNLLSATKRAEEEEEAEEAKKETKAEKKKSRKKR
jgi:large subunit ribosomal protein L32e